MPEAAGTPFQHPGEAPSKVNPWIIAIVVIVVACCCCFGVLGLIFGFWEPIMQELGLYTQQPILVVLS